MPNSPSHQLESIAPAPAPVAPPASAPAARAPAAAAALSPPVNGIARVAPISDPHRPPHAAPSAVVGWRLWSTRSLPLFQAACKVACGGPDIAPQSLQFERER